MMTDNFTRAAAAIALALRVTPSFANAAVDCNNLAAPADPIIIACTEVIRKNPDVFAAYINCGIGHERKGETGLAIADYSKAIQLNPEGTAAYSYRGNAYYRKGEYGRAIADFNEAIRLIPNFNHAYALRGFAYYAKGD
jgi:tetratricopeptide (TPR) repeat protein